MLSARCGSDELDPYAVGIDQHQRRSPVLVDDPVVIHSEGAELIRPHGESPSVGDSESNVVEWGVGSSRRVAPRGKAQNYDNLARPVQQSDVGAVLGRGQTIT